LEGRKIASQARDDGLLVVRIDWIRLIDWFLSYRLASFRAAFGGRTLVS